MKSCGEKDTIHSTWRCKYLPERVGFALLLKDGGHFTIWLDVSYRSPSAGAAEQESAWKEILRFAEHEATVTGNERAWKTENPESI